MFKGWFERLEKYIGINGVILSVVITIVIVIYYNFFSTQALDVTQVTGAMIICVVIIAACKAIYRKLQSKPEPEDE